MSGTMIHMPVDAIATSNPEEIEWLTSSTLVVTVVGASGDLAKKKTYPSLLNLYDDNLLPKNVRIVGYARSQLTDDELRDRLRPYLAKTSHTAEVVERFLSRCVYQGGTSYGDVAAFTELKGKMEAFEAEFMKDDIKKANRLFYFAIPPNVFADTALAIKQTCMQDDSKGWTRLIVEKPFGRDLESFEVLNKTLSEHFTEDHLYRIDHYLGKEMVQALTVFRFSNWIERVWNKDNIQCVILTFKEPFGTQGRGGYFDNFGIIRDILQNHLLQVMTLLAMETPQVLEGPGASKAIRDAKVAVLKAIKPIDINDVILGQYEDYASDPTITNKETTTPTFATIMMKINNPRWAGVPFILKAGKALNERKAEMRIQFKDVPATEFLFQGMHTPRNELVIRMQPSEAIYFKTNVKSPGFSARPIQSELEVNYNTRFFANHKEANPDAYTRLILDVLQGKHASFVRDDELRTAWEIFTPLLHKIESEKTPPIVYEQGGRGPAESDLFITEKAGYIHYSDYVYHEPTVTRKSDGHEAPKQDPAAAAKAIPKEPPASYKDDELCDIGLFGLAVMGQNFALNMAEHGFKVCVGNRSAPKIEQTVARAKAEGDLPIVGSKNPQDFIARLRKPRKLVILVQAGKPVDDTISTLSRYMEPGDLIIDGGNEWFPNSIRRAKFLEPKGIDFIGMGISGGEEGARHGPSLMPGGPRKAYELVEEILTKCAAQSSTGSCAGYLGPVGSGNYVKMVHNGIEYGDMQLIAEVYDVMKTLLKLDNEEMAKIFEAWNLSKLKSYLIEITASILKKKDDQGKPGYVVDYVLDKTGMKGTGKWTIQEAAEKAVAAPTMAASLDARMMSGRKEERVEAEKVLSGPDLASGLNKAQILDDLKAALYASKVCSYAQGLSLIKAASDEYNWNVSLAECARLWTGGCIIRAGVLDRIQKAFSEKPDLPNLLVDPGFAAELVERSTEWRRLIALCVTNGIACPSLCNSLNYFDTYRRGSLPANLTQAQRDFFGGHTYERTDMEGRFHTAWTDAHKDIGDANQRTAGEKLQT